MNDDGINEALMIIQDYTDQARREREKAVVVKDTETKTQLDGAITALTDVHRLISEILLPRS